MKRIVRTARGLYVALGLIGFLGDGPRGEVCVSAAEVEVCVSIDRSEGDDPGFPIPWELVWPIEPSRAPRPSRRRREDDRGDREDRAE